MTIVRSTDVYGPEKRSAVMRRVKGRDTTPEMTVRRALTRLGARYRLHRKDLPGNPDIVLPGRRIAFFVHGCFWHGRLRPRRPCPEGEPRLLGRQGGAQPHPRREQPGRAGGAGLARGDDLGMRAEG